MKLDMKEATRQLQELVKVKGMSHCHLCEKPYADYEHSYHGVTKKDGKAVAVCVDCVDKLKYGISFGINTPPEIDQVALREAYYSHPWSGLAERRQAMN